MPVVEDILVRLRAENDQLKAKLAESRVAIDDFKGRFPIEAKTDQILGELDALDESLDRTSETLDEVESAAKRASDGLDDAAESSVSLERLTAAAVVGLFVLKQELESVGRVGNAIKDLVPEGQAEKIETELELIKRGFSGPISFIVANIERATGAWSDFLEELGKTETELSPALRQLIEDGESVQQIFLKLYDDITATGPALERQADALLAVSNRLRSTGEESQQTNAQLGQQARDLADQFEELGVAIPNALQRVIDRTQSAVDVVDRLGAAEKAAAEEAKKAASEAERAAKEYERAAKAREDAIGRFTESLGLNKQALEERADVAVAGATRILESETLTVDAAEILRQKLEEIAAAFALIGEEAPADLQAVLDQLQPAADLASDVADRIAKLDEKIKSLRESEKTGVGRTGSDEQAKSVEALASAQRKLREETERLTEANEKGQLDAAGLQDLFDAQTQLREVTNDLAEAQRDQAKATESQVIAFGPAISDAEALAEAYRALASDGGALVENSEAAAAGAERFQGAAAGAKVEVEQLADGTFRLSNTSGEAAIQVERLEDGTLKMSNAAAEVKKETEDAADGFESMGKRAGDAKSTLEALERDGSEAVRKLGVSVEVLDQQIIGLLTRFELLRDVMIEIRELGEEGV